MFVVKMPMEIYAGFLGRCLLSSREYAVLKNSVVDRASGSLQILCSPAEASLIREHAKRFYPAAVAYIESALEELPERAATVEYRRSPAGDTWHFRSECSQWPAADYMAAKSLPQGDALCNECIVKNQQPA
jgi:hypothetical protein